MTDSTRYCHAYTFREGKLVPYLPNLEQGTVTECPSCRRPTRPGYLCRNKRCEGRRP